MISNFTGRSLEPERRAMIGTRLLDHEEVADQQSEYLIQRRTLQLSSPLHHVSAQRRISSRAELEAGLRIHCPEALLLTLTKPMLSRGATASIIFNLEIPVAWIKAVITTSVKGTRQMIDRFKGSERALTMASTSFIQARTGAATLGSSSQG